MIAGLLTPSCLSCDFWSGICVRWWLCCTEQQLLVWVIKAAVTLTVIICKILCESTIKRSQPQRLLGRFPLVSTCFLILWSCFCDSAEQRTWWKLLSAAGSNLAALDEYWANIRRDFTSHPFVGELSFMWQQISECLKRKRPADTWGCLITPVGCRLSSWSWSSYTLTVGRNLRDV